MPNIRHSGFVIFSSRSLRTSVPREALNRRTLRTPRRRRENLSRPARSFVFSSFGLRHSFDIRISDFVISPSLLLLDEPDVAVHHRVAEVLQVDRAGLRAFFE